MTNIDFEERVAFYKENFTLEELAKIMALRDISDKTTTGNIDRWFPNKTKPFEVTYDNVNNEIQQAVMDEKAEKTYFDTDYSVTMPDGVQFNWLNTSFD